MRGFAVYLLFALALPRYILEWARALILPPRFPRPSPDVSDANTAEAFDQYFSNATRAVAVVKTALALSWAIGILLAAAIRWPFLAIPAFTTFVFLSWYFQTRHQIEVAGARMISRTYFNLWSATLGQAAEAIQADPKLRSTYKIMDQAIKDGDTTILDAVKDSVTPAEWYTLRQAKLMEMGRPDKANG